MTGEEGSLVRSRQDPLRERYLENPADALITDEARAAGGVTFDALHGRVVPGSRDYGISYRYGIHRAVGGDHDLPNPGDLLSAALAACLDSTIRMVADRMGIRLERLEVHVDGDVDVRGTLMMDRNVQVGFQRMSCDVDIRADVGADPTMTARLLRAAERSCVVLQTLRHGVEVRTTMG